MLKQHRMCLIFVHMNYTKAGVTLYDWVSWLGKLISAQTKLFLTSLRQAILQVDASRGHCLSTSLPVPISNEFVFLHYSSWLQEGYKYQRRVRWSRLWVHLQLSTSVASIFHSTIFEDLYSHVKWWEDSKEGVATVCITYQKLAKSLNEQLVDNLA
jgi:hypothetical protein